MTQSQTLLVNRTDFADVTLVKSDLPGLLDNHIRVKVGPFALTANNITYMVTGDMIGYWKFFDPEAYGIDLEGAGRMPVWGYARIIESRCEGLRTGERIYGFFPIVDQFDMAPAKLHPLGFMDGAAHRRELHPVYNSYVRTQNDPSFAAGLDDIQPILRPLFTTSFLIDDLFGAENFFGAEQIIVISASSKTALGTAFCLKERGGVEVVGLTSARNKDFVKSIGFYDQVATYDTVSVLTADKKSAIIDMAGNGDVTAKLYNHFGANIVYNCMVGKSHWQGGAPPKISAGAPPSMFFAPDRARLRIGEWGPDGFAKNLGERWIPFCKSAKSWLDIDSSEGISALLPVYKKFLDGEALPTKGYLFSI